MSAGLVGQMTMTMISQIKRAVADQRQFATIYPFEQCNNLSELVLPINCEDELHSLILMVVGF